jgi:hypothetical protein
MPEAFNMGGAFKALAPTLAGAALTGMTGGAINPLTAGLIIGGLTAAKTGNVTQGAMAGLGAYGGGGLEQSLTTMAPAAGAAPGATSGVGMTGGNAGLTPTGASTIGVPNTATAQTGLLPDTGVTGIRPPAAETMFNSATPGPSWMDRFTTAAGGKGAAAMQLGAPVAAGLMGGQEYNQAPTEPGYDPNSRLNLGGFAPLRLAGGGAINNTGIMGVYGTPDNPQGPPISQDGYGLGRLNSMAMNQQNNGFARGGYLDGAGDGMSDSIPAKIDGKQPAALADGEFVIPADVVSHIGNGSTKAGAHRLYDMLAKIRKARTGNSAQGKQINPRKFMPA